MEEEEENGPPLHLRMNLMEQRLKRVGFTSSKPFKSWFLHGFTDRRYALANDGPPGGIVLC